MTAKDLRKEALGLSRVERARLARELLESLDDSTDADAEQAWLEEVEHRSAGAGARKCSWAAGEASRTPRRTW